MTNNNNLYSEVMVTESPFYYDANGRLRARVLNEASYISTADMRMDPVTGKVGPSKTVKISDDAPPTPPTSGGLFGKLKNKQRSKIVRGGGNVGPGGTVEPPAPRAPAGPGGSLGMIARPAVMPKEPVPAAGDNRGGMMRTADFQDRDLDGTDDRDQTPSKPAPAPIQSVKGPGRNTNTRAGLRGVDNLRARGAELKKRGREVLARTAELRGKLGVKRGEAGKARLGEPMSPEQKAEKKGMKAEFRALKGEKKAMKASGQKPSAEMKLKLRDMKSKLKSMPKGGKNNMRAMMKRGGSRLSMQESAPATDYLYEKMNLKTAKMGDVIKDFQESDAPQFKGKSKAKRRIMAIAAKLQAERG